MNKQESKILEKILKRLQSLDPPIKKIAVEAPDPAMTMCFLDLADVCYITTKLAANTRAETMYVTDKSEQYFNNMSLKKLEKLLKDHPHFMRTSKSTIINLTKLRGFKFSSARDLWFKGVEEPVINAVSATYLDAFEANFK
jgi:DNA-binding LytR/AlgR family response regulator